MSVETTAFPNHEMSVTKRYAIPVMFAILLASYVVNAMDRQVFSLLGGRCTQGIRLLAR